MAGIKSSLWVEHFRPTTLKDIVLPKEYNTYFESIIKTR
jgi:hypothetical protein